METRQNHNERPSTSSAPLAATVGALAGTAALAALGTSIANVTLPTLAAAFGAPLGTVQWVILAYLLASTVVMVPAGRLGDARGRRRVLLVGVAVFTVASALAAVSPNLGLLATARAIQGAGAALVSSMTVALVRQNVPADRVGSVMGTIGSAMAAGMALGPAVGGWLLGAFGWPAVFVALVPIGLLSGALLLVTLPRDPSSQELRSLDPIGTILLALSLSAYTVAVTLQPGGPLITAAVLALAVVAAGAFLQVERRTADPLVAVAQLRSLNLFPGLAMAMIAALVMMTYLVVGLYYVSGGLGLSGSALGAVMAVGPVVAVLSGAPAGRLVDRLGSRRVVLLGLIEITVGAAALVVLPVRFGLVGFLIASVILTPGNQLFMAANNTAVMRAAGRESQGVVSGVLNLARNVGQITGASVMAIIFSGAAAASGSSASAAPGATAGMQVAFGVSAILGVIAIALAARRDTRVEAVATNA